MSTPNELMRHALGVQEQGRYRSDAARPAVDMGLAAVLERGALAAVLPLRKPG